MLVQVKSTTLGMGRPRGGISSNVGWSWEATLSLQMRLQYQQNPVADEVSAITAVVRPILEGLLYALKAEVVAEFGGHGNVKLFMLPRLYRPGDRDCGICFEYAVHDALNRGES